ncbi:hypothetical protein CR513_48336, partial [Mucuna pruriens]
MMVNYISQVIKGKSKEKDHDNDRVTTTTGNDLVILRDFESVNFVSDESMWIIDSSATLQVTPRKELFTSYTSSDFGVLKIGMQLWLRGVKHALDVRFNLIFVHMLDDGGYHNHFVHGKWKLTKGLKNAKLEKCSHCMAGKQAKVSFKKHSPSRKSELLELVHSDVCVPLKVKSFSGALYFVTFIDDCSRKLWVYVLKTKDQVLEKFKQFQVLIEKQSGKKGIRHEKTPPKTPQLNGLAERMNMTLIERVRCMLSEARLPKHFWGEALYTAMHVINLSPAVALNTEVLNNIWFGKDVKHDHLRVFGCKAFVNVPKDERSKLDMKTRVDLFCKPKLRMSRPNQEHSDPIEASWPKRSGPGQTSLPAK